MLAASLLSIALAPAPNGTLTVDAGRGPVTVHLPAGYDPTVPAPLIVMLHGFGGSGPQVDAYFDLRSLQDAFGFLTCAPSGSVNGVGARFWNATDACCDFGNTNIDDSGYLRSLIEAIESAAAVDPRRIHVVGHSNGGFMTHRMACDHPDKIASIMSLAGATFADPLDCIGSGPVHVLQVHGTADNTILYNGGVLLGVPYPGAVATVQQWAMRNGCSLNNTVQMQALDLDSGILGSESSITRFDGPCDQGGSSELWTIPGGAHSPALTSEFRAEVVRFLLEHPKPGVDFSRYCTPASTNSSGAPARMDASGSDAVVDNALTLVAEDLPTNTFGYFLTSRTQGLSVPPGSQGTICLGGSIGRFSAFVQSSGGAGTFSLTIDLTSVPGNPPAAAVPGDTWNFQAWFRDANPMNTSNLTDGIEVTIH